MTFKNWILPILIGLVAVVILMSILYSPQIINKFSDLGALIQLQTSRPAYYVAGMMPLDYNLSIPEIPVQGNITSVDSPLYVGSQSIYPVYNYYPHTPLNTVANSSSNNINTNVKSNTTKPTKNDDLAFSNPMQKYNSHKAFYWALSGGYPYPVILYPDTNMDNLRGVEDKI